LLYELIVNMPSYILMTVIFLDSLFGDAGCSLFLFLGYFVFPEEICFHF